MLHLNGLSPSQKRLMKTVYDQSGIESRYSCLTDFGSTRGDFNFFPNEETGSLPPISKRMRIYQEYAAPMAVTAIESCLEQAAFTDVESITHLITFSCTGMAAPGLDIELTQKLGLSPQIARTCINFMGCYAAITALRTASDIINGNPDAVVLLAGVELCSLHFLPTPERDQFVANAIFADGAAAVLLSGKKPVRQLGFSLDTFHSAFMPDGGTNMAWLIGEAGFEIKLSSYVPKLLESGMSELLGALKTKTGQSSFDHYAIHPGGRSILEAAETSLNISKEQLAPSYQVLSEFGNMSSVTLLYVLSEFLNGDYDLKTGQRMLACAFGPGLTLESAVLTVS